METKKIIGWGVGLAALFVTIYVASKAWSRGQKG
jgi:hypothetical protein